MKMNEYSITVGCGRILKGTRSPIMWTFCFGMIATPVLATTIISSISDAIMGRAPTVSEIIITPAAPKAGDSVTVSWAYFDEDGDKEGSTLVEWLLDGKVSSMASNSTFDLSFDSANKILQVRVTPRSVESAYPTTGISSAGNQVVIDEGNCALNTTLVDTSQGLAFTCPSTTAMAWSEADSYCKKLTPAARLPSPNELQKLFVNQTSATAIVQNFKTVNAEMCTRYGWPLGTFGTPKKSYCGGANRSYWASGNSPREYPGYNNMIYMDNGNYDYRLSTAQAQVTCVRNKS